MTTAVTPDICVAAKRGDQAEVESLLAADASAALASDESAGGKTALASAAGGGHAKIVKALLAAGAKDEVCKGWSAACHAAFKGHAEVLAELATKLGVAAVTAPEGVSMPPLLKACAAGHLACVTLMLDAAPKALEARDPAGRTALMHAAASGNAELVQYLAKRGAPLNDVCVHGKTALMWAIEAHRPATVGALAQLGADPTVRSIASPLAVQVPGKDMTKGDTVAELADAKNSRDPTMRLISTYVREYLKQHEEGAEVPPIARMDHITHAEQFVVAEAAAAAAAKAAAEAPPPAPAGEPAASAESDIFGGDDDEPTIVEEGDEQPVGSGQAEGGQADFKAAAESARDLAKSESMDLDELD